MRIPRRVKKYWSMPIIDRRHDRRVVKWMQRLSFDAYREFVYAIMAKRNREEQWRR